MFLKKLKLFSVGLILGSTIFCFSPFSNASSISDQEKKEKIHFNKFNSLKMNSTIEDIAKVIYGKEYKKELKKENGITVFKKKELVKGIGSSSVYYYSFFPKKVKWDKYSINKMIISLNTKKNGKTLYLTYKMYALPSENKNETGIRESKNYLQNGKKIKKNMSINDLDKLLSGKGLGDWSSLDYSDLTKTGIYSEEKNKFIFPNPSKSQHYQFKTLDKKTTWQVTMLYDAKKRDYFVSDCYIIGN
ncbi:hypothetical protein [Exiguobacterium sp. K1]|uniref:hypothetical protein n=1 Tax=Exiguobacterium sp. K1 TaxID=2980105 RepID=UPI00299DA81B|nr:hypothetical protein [Exiguobacterium sp. K1]MDX1260554.1 hypothetical protein [Exiguobacterium sp. K1]